jgi:hypothetical protein
MPIRYILPEPSASKSRPVRVIAGRKDFSPFGLACHREITAPHGIGGKQKRPGVSTGPFGEVEQLIR